MWLPLYCTCTVPDRNRNDTAKYQRGYVTQQVGSNGSHTKRCLTRLREGHVDTSPRSAAAEEHGVHILHKIHSIIHKIIQFIFMLFTIPPLISTAPTAHLLPTSRSHLLYMYTHIPTCPLSSYLCRDCHCHSHFSKNCKRDNITFFDVSCISPAKKNSSTMTYAL